MDTHNTHLARRTALNTLGAGTIAALVGSTSEAKAADSAPAFAGQHTPEPLPFDPAKLEGISEKVIQSHWQNNYIGSVNALNMIEGRLAAAMQDPDVHPLVYTGLKREELHRTGSVILHELYFGALGGDGKPGGDIASGLANAFGSVEAWQAEFLRISGGLGGGSGWVMLSYNMHTNSLHSYWAPDHMHNATAGVPLLALDMYEHSYHMDYGTAARRYVDAFMANVDWEVVDQRYGRALRMAAA